MENGNDRGTSLNVIACLQVRYRTAQGSVAERPNALALKASVGETTGGSNPSASADVLSRVTVDER